MCLTRPRQRKTGKGTDSEKLVSLVREGPLGISELHSNISQSQGKLTF